MAHSEEDKRTAKRWYLEGINPTEISERLEIPYHTINHWIKKGSKGDLPWHKVKSVTTDQNDLVERLKTPDVEPRDIIKLGLNQIYKGLADMELRDVILDVTAMRKLAGVLDMLNKLDNFDMTARDVDDVNIQHPGNPFLDDNVG